jgi:hypothetical protein
MVVNTTWSAPNVAAGSGGTDLAAGDTYTETVHDRIQSNLYRLGGSDGDTKTGRWLVDQATADTTILEARSTGDVAHGVTSIVDTAAYFYVQKNDAAAGGAQLGGVSETSQGVAILGIATTEDTTHNGGGVANINLIAYLKSGSTVGTHGANANLFRVADGSGTQYILDKEGDMFNNGASGTATVFDGEDDGALVEAVSLLMAPARADSYRFRLARDLEAHKEALAAGGVITLNPDGTLAMLSYKGVLGLLIDAIRQVTHAHRALEARVAPLLPAAE